MPHIIKGLRWFTAAQTYIKTIGKNRFGRISAKFPKKVGVVIAIVALGLFTETAFSVSPKSETEVIYGGPAESVSVGAQEVVFSAMEAVPGIFDEGELLEDGPSFDFSLYQDGAANTSGIFDQAIASQGQYYIVRPGDTFYSVAEHTGIEQKALAAANRGVTDPLIVGDHLVLPTPKATAVASNGIASWSGFLPPEFIYPAVGPIGLAHAFHAASLEFQAFYGVDIPNKSGTPIHAAGDGVVVATQSGWDGGYGNYIEIMHEKVGAVTMYAHILDGGILVVPGQKVKKGEVIAYMGSTGRSTGPHIHFEVRKLAHSEE
jgi:LysM repeat protein